MPNIEFTLLLLAIFGAAALAAAFLVRDRKKVQHALAKTKGHEVTPPHLIRSDEEDFPPSLIDRPLLNLDDDTPINIEKEPYVPGKMEAVDEPETVLLKAAEIVVEKIQYATGHLDSNPPNVEEVVSKIKAIVQPYTLFRDTEYFDALNSFIAITAERDCQIQLSKQQLLALWC